MEKDIATISMTKEIMTHFGLHTKKGYGQNFITDANTVRKIASECNLTKEDAVIEVGPGIGALTQQLARLAGHVIAYEIDDTLIPVLSHTLSKQPNVQIRHQDFLTTNFADVVKQLKATHQGVIVAANLPYYITTPILFHIFEAKSEVDRIVVMMQKEVADRFYAKPNTKDYNALSIITQYLWDVRIVMKVSRNIFEPKPNVDSAVVEFKKKENPITVNDEQGLFALIKACFVQRRKTIYNNYQQYCMNKEIAMNNLNRAGIAASARAESLDMQSFIRLHEVHEASR